MITINKIEKRNKNEIKKVVDIHLRTFTGFFLTFLGKGFLTQMYRSYCEDVNSGILVAKNEKEEVVGFLAYSNEYSNLYKRMIKRRLIPFAWYSFWAFLRKPKIFIRLVRAFLKPSETERKEKYVELASIGVDPNCESKGIGSMLISKLVEITDFEVNGYISLETDAVNNDKANYFYVKNGFVLERTYETHEGRKMNEYRRGK